MSDLATQVEEAVALATEGRGSWHHATVRVHLEETNDSVGDTLFSEAAICLIERAPEWLAALAAEVKDLERGAT